jgi:hypothetical protein
VPPCTEIAAAFDPIASAFPLLMLPPAGRSAGNRRRRLVNRLEAKTPLAGLSAPNNTRGIFEIFVKRCKKYSWKSAVSDCIGAWRFTTIYRPAKRYWEYCSLIQFGARKAESHGGHAGHQPVAVQSSVIPPVFGRRVSGCERQRFTIYMADICIYSN